MKRYIRKYEMFKADKNIGEPVNEFIGSLLKDIFKNAKNKLSLSVSKSIGGAKEVDKAIDEYKNKLFPLLDEENTERLKVVKYQKETEGDIGEKELKSKISELEKAVSNIEKRKSAIKNTFDIKLNNIIKNISDDNIKDYAKLMRTELAEEVVAKQLGIMEEEGIDELKDDSYTKNYITTLRDLASKATEQTKKLADVLEKAIKGGSDNDSVTFDLKSAIENPDEYIWEDSPFNKEKLADGTEVIYFSRTNAKEVGEEYKVIELRYQVTKKILQMMR